MTTAQQEYPGLVYGALGFRAAGEDQCFDGKGGGETFWCAPAAYENPAFAGEGFDHPYHEFGVTGSYNFTAATPKLERIPDVAAVPGPESMVLIVSALVALWWGFR